MDLRRGIPCMLMRGGTSKGAYFLATDLPANPAERDDLLLRVMGSPDPQQIDGVGGGHPLTSKVAVVSRSSEPGVDVDYLFLQVVVDAPVVSDAQTCGNLLAGVGPFALERRLVNASGTGASVRIRLLNTGDVATATFMIEDGWPRYDGAVAIDGVPGTAAPIDLDISGEGRPLLPSGSVVDEIDGHLVTLIDNGMPVVLARGDEFGVTGQESAGELEEREELARSVERLRVSAGRLMGLGNVAEQTVPKVILLSPPRAGGAVRTRAFIPRRVHSSIGVLMAASVAAGIRIPRAVGSDFAVVLDDEAVSIEHPSGSFVARVRVQQHPDGQWRAASVSRRTARKLFDGAVFPRPATAHYERTAP